MDKRHSRVDLELLRDGRRTTPPFPWTKEWAKAKGQTCPPDAPSFEEYRSKLNATIMTHYDNGVINWAEMKELWLL